MSCERLARRGRCAAVSLLLCLVACGDPGAPAPPAPVSAPPSAAAIMAIEIAGRPAVFTVSTEALRAVAAPLAAAITRSQPALAALTPAERIAWQNDLLGVASRARAALVTDVSLLALADAAEAAARELAPPPDAGAPFSCPDAPPLLDTLLPAAEGWRENGTEMPVLSHERAFALRRVFRVYARGDLRAIASQLVVVDTEGVAHTSCVAGEIELLDVGPDGARSARVWELDRAALARGPEHALREVDAVSHVPDLGADSLFLDESSPVPLADVPCRRCHDDATEMSLPRADLAPGPRIAALLAQFPAPWP